MHRGRIAATAGLGLAAIVALAWLGAALADDPAAAVTPAAPPTELEAAVAAGTSLRIEGPRGPVHVWIPAGYEPDTGATIVYVHGYWSTADTAWTAHQLAPQFALSALNAMFIVPEAPSQPRVPVNYPDLGELLRLVEAATGVPRGAALLAAVGHSGGYRTLEAWLDEPLLDQLVMVDALYGDEDMIVEWATAADRRRLIMVGQDTLLGAEAIADRLPNVVTLDQFPPTYELWPRDLHRAQVIYVRSQFGHMQMVTTGEVLPAVLRLLPVRQLASLPWKLPLDSLPAVVDAGVAPPTPSGR